MSDKKIRVLVGKVGLDGHDRGAKVIARSLMEGGMEVIYTGLHLTPEQIAQSAIQEDVDIVGLSILSGAHMTLLPKIISLLKKQGAKIPVLAGGIISDEDRRKLKRLGVLEVFGPGTHTQEVISFIKQAVATRTKQKQIKRTTIRS